MASQSDEIIIPPKTRGVAENDLVLRASELVDVVLEFRRRLGFMRSHVKVLWALILEIERLVKESTTMDPFTRQTLLRLCASRSRTGVVGDVGRDVIIPDGGPTGEPVVE